MMLSCLTRNDFSIVYMNFYQRTHLHRTHAFDPHLQIYILRISSLTERFIAEPHFLAKTSEVLNAVYLECYNQREIRRQAEGKEEKFDFIFRFENLAKQYAEVLGPK